MAISESLFLTVFLLVFVYLAQSNAFTDCQTSSCCDRVAFELELANLRIVRLESILEERIRDVNAKNKYLSECQRKIDDLEVEIDRIKEVLSSFVDDSSKESQKLDALDEEVRLLWDASRKNNFEIHVLELKESDAERRLNEIIDQVEGMAEIVSEHWIQIQRLEQALHMAEIRTSKLKRASGWTRCPMIKKDPCQFSSSLKL
ncbi:coiled-coil domain-containing protein 18-like [Dorcoceras hygrometricum]|uniref:Coiled-coil domain-containing protein 18-like n=1 Tax=Dorcoceras hygrometricum TaxID=472368 RepID=A0A2Z7D1V7_9LAMI|nr:coiled-coil domain-containing protein 18-like [Dorcoceras hygrometricum]